MFENEKVILTDCDGVLLEWSAAFTKYLAERHDMHVVNADVYSMSKMYDVDYDVMRPLVCEFNKSQEMLELAGHKDAVHYVRKLVSEGWKFVVITSQTDDKFGAAFRRTNLMLLFGSDAFKEVKILGCGDDKDEALEPYKDSGLYWVEDKPENADLGASLGLKSLLMKHNHNEDGCHYKSVKTVNNWKEIYEMVAEK